MYVLCLCMHYANLKLNSMRWLTVQLVSLSQTDIMITGIQVNACINCTTGIAENETDSCHYTKIVCRELLLLECAYVQ